MKQTDKERYRFAPSSHIPGYYDVHDLFLGGVTAVWPPEMAMMIGMMYHNTCQGLGNTAGNEFLYGCLLGHTMTTLHADKLPKLEIVKADAAGVEMKFTMPDGRVMEHTEKMADGGPAMEGLLSKMGLMPDADTPPDEPIH